MCVHKETNKFYIGYRERNNIPSSFDLPKYKTSSNTVRPNFHEYNWSIIAEFFDGKSAYQFEQYLIHLHWSDPLLLNKLHHYFSKNTFRTVGPMNLTSEMRNRIGDRRRGKKHTAETLAKMRGPQQNKASNIECPHCDISGNCGAMKRWHFDNCKFRLEN